MAKILVCIEDLNEVFKDVNQTAYAFYSESVRPDLIQAGHEVRYTTCAEVWTALNDEPVEILLMFVEREQSCCWQIARHIRDEWSSTFGSPLIVMTFYWDDPLLLSDYYILPEYSRLYDYCVEGSRWKGFGIARRLDIFLTRSTFDLQTLEDQIAALFPGSKERWSLDLITELSHHFLIHLSTHTTESTQYFNLVWSRNKTILVLDSWEKYTHLIKESRLTLANDLNEMLAIFSSFQQKNIVEVVQQPNTLLPKWKLDLLPEKVVTGETLTYSLLVPKEKILLLSRYAGIVHRPAVWANEEEQQARFWTVEIENGNLEEWLFIQKEETLQIQSWLREEEFAFDLKNCISYSNIPADLMYEPKTVTEPFTRSIAN